MAVTNRLPVAIVIPLRRGKATTTQQIFPGLLSEAEAEALETALVAEGAAPGESIFLAVDPPLEGDYFRDTVLAEVRMLHSEGYEILRPRTQEASKVDVPSVGDEIFEEDFSAPEI